MTIVPRSLRNQTSGGEMDATPSAFNVVIRLQGLQISILVWHRACWLAWLPVA